MHMSVLDEIFATMMVSSVTETHTVVDKTHGSSAEVSYESSPVCRLAPFHHDLSDPWTVISASVGKTVDIGNKENARVTISVTCAVKQGDRSTAFPQLEALVWNMVERDVHSVKSPASPPLPDVVYPFDDERCPRVTIAIEYGLTINMGNWEFTKPTIGSSSIVNSSEFATAYASLSDFLSEQMKTQVKKAKYGSASAAL
jgi:hypothetical protein